MASFDRLRQIVTRPAGAGRCRVTGAHRAAAVRAALARRTLPAQLASQRERQTTSGTGFPAETIGARSAWGSPVGKLVLSEVGRA